LASGEEGRESALLEEEDDTAELLGAYKIQNQRTINVKDRERTIARRNTEGTVLHTLASERSCSWPFISAAALWMLLLLLRMSCIACSAISARSRSSSSAMDKVRARYAKNNK